LNRQKKVHLRLKEMEYFGQKCFPTEQKILTSGKFSQNEDEKIIFAKMKAQGKNYALVKLGDKCYRELYIVSNGREDSIQSVVTQELVSAQTHGQTLFS
jgi:hypothetical protein